MGPYKPPASEQRRSIRTTVTMSLALYLWDVLQRLCGLGRSYVFILARNCSLEGVAAIRLRRNSMDSTGCI